MNSFLATGGDNFTIFRDGTDPLGGPQDIDASKPISPPRPPRPAGAGPDHEAEPALMLPWLAFVASCLAP